MTIEDIFIEIRKSDNTNNSIYNYETFILNLLKSHIEGQNKKFLIVESSRGIGDAIAENGFDNIEGSTLIDIAYILPTANRLDIYTNKIGSIRIEDFKNFLIINFRRSSEINRILIKKLKGLYPSINFIAWGLEDLNKLVNKHKKKSIEIANNLFSLRLENAVIKESGDWEKEREEKIIQLKEYYNKAQFSLFLGAGVSSSAGMPDWNTLLNSLFVSYLTKELGDESNISDKDIRQIVDRLNNIDEPSALMAARYLRKGLAKQQAEIKEFSKIITDNLYKLRNVKEKLDSDLIASIVHLCMPRRTGAKVKSVITYNFDDLIERQLNEKSIMHHSIYTDNELFDPDELPIYHVHGFLPEDVEKYDGLEKSTLVFSEEGYHQIYTDAYHWSNLVQLANLRDNNCLMVGLSLTDPNLRRLLDIASRNIESPKHFAFMKRMKLESFAYTKNKDSQYIDNIKGAENFLNRHHKLNEEIMKELGVTIIWYDNYEEIPEILKKII